MSVKITITNAGAGISPTLDVYTNTGGIWTYFTTVTLGDLIAGYTFDPPIDADSYRIIDNGNCGTILELSCTTTTTTTEPETTTTTTTIAPPVYRYFGIDYSSQYNSAIEACNDVSCFPETAVGCSSYYSFNNTLNESDILYSEPSMSTPVVGGFFYFSMALTINGVPGPKMVVQLDNGGVIMSVSTCVL